MKLSKVKYDDEDAYYAVNLADYDAKLNSTDGAPEIIKELRRATNEVILRQAKKEGQRVVKVGVGTKPPTAKVRGYATFLSFIKGSGLADLERKLGFRAGVLQQHGAYIYHVDGLSLNANNIAPRGNTDWSAGVTPRDLDTLSKESGVSVGNHRDYPSATKPVLQFAILEEVSYVGEPVFIKPGGRV